MTLNEIIKVLAYQYVTYESSYEKQKYHFSEMHLCLQEHGNEQVTGIWTNGKDDFIVRTLGR